MGRVIQWSNFGVFVTIRIKQPISKVFFSTGFGYPLTNKVGGEVHVDILKGGATCIWK
jgi:hypothetical protein